MSEIGTLSALLHRRHSCRGFLPDQVADDLIEQIVTTAGRVPSWCNAQPWQVVVTKGGETDRFRAALAADIATGVVAPDLDWPLGYSGPARSRRKTCGLQLYEAVGVARGDRAASAAQMMRNYDLFDAPHVAIITSPRELGPYGAVDCGAFVTAFTLAAEALGVASIPQAAIVQNGKFVRDWFGIGDDRLAVCGISFGYRNETHPANGFRTDRAPLDEILSYKKD